MKDIFGINIQKKFKKWGTPIYIQLAIIKMESDFDYSQTTEAKLFKVIPLNVHQVHLVIHKQLKGLGNNIKRDRK